VYHRLSPAGFDGKTWQIVYPKNRLDLAKRIPGSVLESFDGGHMVSSGSTVASRRRVLDFFEE